MNGFWERLAFAFRCFFSILFHSDIPLDIATEAGQACRSGSAGGDCCCSFRLPSEGG